MKSSSKQGTSKRNAIFFMLAGVVLYVLLLGMIYLDDNYSNIIDDAFVNGYEIGILVSVLLLLPVVIAALLMAISHVLFMKESIKSNRLLLIVYTFAYSIVLLLFLSAVGLLITP